MTAASLQLREYLDIFPEKTRQKGQVIFDNKWLKNNPLLSGQEIPITLIKEGSRSAHFSIPSQTDYSDYDVLLSWTKIKVSARCNCRAFHDYGPCKHIVAAVFCLLDEWGDEEETRAAEEAIAQGKPSEPASNELLLKLTLKEHPKRFFQAIDRLMWANRTSQSEMRKIVDCAFLEDEGIWDFGYYASAKQTYHMRIAYDRQQTFELSCSCMAKDQTCIHLRTAAAFLFENEGGNYFLQFKDFSREKAELLAKIGLSDADQEAALVRFHVDSWGEIKMDVPKWLWTSGNANSRLQQLQSRLGLKLPEQQYLQPVVPATIAKFEPAFVFQTATSNLPFPFELAVVNTAGGKFAKFNTLNRERWPELKAVLPKDVYNSFLGISLPLLNELLKADGYYHHLPDTHKNLGLSGGAVRLLLQHYTEALQQLWPWLCEPTNRVFTTSETRVTLSKSSAIQLHAAPVDAVIFISPAGKFIDLSLQYREQQGGAAIEGHLEQVAGLLLKDGDTWYLPADESTRRLMQQFPLGYVKFPVTMQADLMRQILPMLRSRYEVVLEESLQPKQLVIDPICRVHLTEQSGKFLVLTPSFDYEGQSFFYDEEPESILTNTDGAWVELQRNETLEKAFVESVRDMHESFAGQGASQSFFISFAQALGDSWFQKMLAQLEDMNIEVLGWDALQHFKYNAHTAKVSVSSLEENASGIDWFDLRIEISFGEQQVSLKEVRKALINGQAGVRLGDGSIGLLPAEFVAEYGTLLKLGTEKGEGKLRVNKLHFTLLDSLHEALLSKDISAEIAAKKEALRNIEQIQTVDVPAGIKASLRPYQAAGYRWLQVLHKLGWGALLADDMGLGKTLQVITFLQFLKETEPGSKHLVVCPTSLIYNWQAELDKFAPDLRYYIHYGLSREWDASKLEGADIVITSYGLMRSDLKILSEIPWGYVVLDESQAIKNPDAQTTKAAQTLPAQNRICMSGTPLQNNTFDLYAQFQFLNPGLLGGRDLFRTEFATPIDKYNEEIPRTTLRKMVAPFMLRRTKEQVAKDLPDKTEVTLWCEMEDEQRAVYNEYRNYYRESLLKRIDDDGMAGSAIYVLEALLRLRQLCDHPKLVKNVAVKTEESIKLQELRREIRENAGGRKLLIFSQFTEMLALIRKALEDDEISYTYLDGKTPAAKRQDAVLQFQTNPEVQVFLISLKAGGVGLNLTAAEYVYLVDPWWNPAVEAQAIDRTHRIGQTNKIVAYRMICKDTVEEKVLLLQQSKRSLADGLITEDAGFVKKLTREDVAYLLE